MRHSKSRFRLLAKSVLMVIFSVAAFALARAEEPKIAPETLREWLKQYPEADANHDGVLTESEARAYAAKLLGNARSVNAPAPTLADVHYGPHARNVLDWWQAKVERPTPVVIYIHGGGFVGGDKSGARRDKLVKRCLDAGVSFAAVNYRFLSADVPIQAVLRDCARAVQFIRYQAAKWNIDKPRIACFGESAGAGTSAWLAFHDDLADPNNADPVLRESTRLACAGSLSGQFSYDFPKWGDVFGEDVRQRFGGRYNSPELYGFKSNEELLGAAGRKVRADCDMLGLISKDDPPVFISAALPDLALVNTGQFLHHPKHSQLLYDRCRELGVPVVASIPALGITPPKDGPASLADFLLQNLNARSAPPAAPGK
jgi:acetyl esterase/lipase